MSIEQNDIKISHSDQYGYYVYTILENYGRVVLEAKIDEIHISLRQKHWIKILTKITNGDIVHMPT